MDKVRSELISYIIKNIIDGGNSVEELRARLKICLNEYDKHNQTTQTVTLEQYISYLQSQYDKEPTLSLRRTIDNARDYLELH